MEARSRAAQDSTLEALRSEISGGRAVLASWVQHVESKGAIGTLFELESWLKGLCAFFDLRHVPMNESEREGMINRSFAPELRIVRTALQQCEQAALQVGSLGSGPGIPDNPHPQISGATDNPAGKLFSQSTPMDSLNVLIDAIHDMRCLMDALRDQPRQDLKLYLGLGRNFRRDLAGCRYVDMLLSQRFRPQHDRVENPLLGSILKRIADVQLQRDVTLALLHLYRLMRYLKLIADALEHDRPLRSFLVIFSLLHEQSGNLCDFFASRFSSPRTPDRMRMASEMIVHFIKESSRRVLDRELASVPAQTDPATIYTRMENGHGLLRNCYQSAVITIVQAFDDSVEPRALFPSMLEGMQQGQKLRKDLWDLRQDLKRHLEKATGLDLNQVLDRIAQFRETSLRLLMYQDWGEFEGCSENLITAADEVEARVLLRRFVVFLEVLLQEVSKRTVLQL